MINQLQISKNQMKEIEKLSSDKMVDDEDLNQADINAENKILAKMVGMKSRNKKHVTITQTDIDAAKQEFYEKEGHLRNNCFDFLEALPMCKPIDTSTLNFGKRKHVRKKPGVADLHCSYFGLFIAIETKIGRNGQSQEQEEYQLNIESSGGIYLLIYQFNDLVREFNVIKKRIENLGLHLNFSNR